MIRLLAPIAVIVGLFIGVSFPGTVSSNTTGAQLAVALTPPTLASGSSPLLTCGWHAICLDPWPDGAGLDWEDGGWDYDHPWYFRGFFYVSDRSRVAFRMFPLVTREGSEVCDVMTVWIAEIHSGALMAIPTYTHVNITNSSSFDWSGSQWTTYQSRQIGVTIDEQDASCSTGSHVHESHESWATNIVTIAENRAYYDETGAQCHTTCGTHTNNDINKRTRSFSWDEGAASH